MTRTRTELRARRSALSESKQALLAERLRGLATRPDRKPAIERRREAGPAPLSFAQQRLWFLDQLVPGNAFYNIPAALPLKFALSVPVLHRCLREIVRRHESLRTSFQMCDDEPVQRVAAHADLPLPVTDLSSDPTAERQAGLVRIATEEGVQPFDLAAGPLLRTRLVKLAADDYVLLITMHHIVSDGWSMGIFFRELFALYRAFAFGLPSPLPALRIQYPDFAVWQRDWLRGEVLEGQLSYWRRQLEDLPTLRMPTDRSRPQVATFQGAYCQVKLPEEEARGLERLAESHGATLFMALTAVFKSLLCRYTSQNDLVIGTPIANRNRPEIEPLIGFFVNNLALRTDLSGKPTAAEVLWRVKEVTLGAYEHQDLPFEKLVEELQPERDLSRNPLTQVTFQLQNTPLAAGELPDEDDVGLRVDRGTSIFDIAFTLWQTKTALVGGIEYCTDLFDEATIAAFLGHFRTLAQAMVTDPGRPIAELPLLDEAERRQILVDWNASAAAFPADLCLHQLVEAQVERTPRAVAVVSPDGELTYADLDRRANRLARLLRARGAGPGSLVGLCMERRPELVVAMLGALKAGAAYVPIDHDLPRARIEMMLADTRASVILTTSGLELPLAGAEVVAIDRATPELAAMDAARLEDPAVAAAAPAYVIYTSGSTGRPKGVVVTHGAAVNHMLWMQSELPLGADDLVLQRTPAHFDASVWEFYAPLQAGARLVFPAEQEAVDTEALADAVCGYGITVLQLVPSLLEMLLDEPALATCTDLRRVFCGGEKLEPRLRNRFFERLAGTELINLYGPTEATIEATWWRCRPAERRCTVPVGVPISNARLYVLDPRLEPVPARVGGEIHIGGPGVALGYLGRPGLTAERFVPDPWSDGGRLYRTGDLGRWRRDGCLEFLGRVDGQIKLRGYRIELGEIEAKLAEHPAVERAVVVCREDDAGVEKLAAYFVESHDYQPEAGDEIGEIEKEHISQWQTVYREIYADESPQHDPTFDIVGWNSTASGEPIPAAEMRAWVDNTVERILALAPRRVLEIGAGTGLVLFRVAPRCQTYLATDFSEQALERLRAGLEAGGPDLPQVSLLHRAAHELDNLGPEPFDTVVVNSVVQYFPSIGYLTELIEGLLQKVVPGGSLFLGDVRSLPLLEAFHLFVDLKADAVVPLGELRGRLAHRRRQEKELVIDPAYFGELRRHLPQLAEVRIQPKRESFHNELSRFRYDVTLTRAPVAAPVEYEWYDWPRQGLSLATLTGLLTAPGCDRLGVTRVPNARVAAEVRALEALARGEVETVGELAARLAEPRPGIDPAALGEIARDHGYAMELRWLRSPADGAVDALFERRDPAAPGRISEPRLRSAPGRAGELWRYANSPLQNLFLQRLMPELRLFLRQRLPDYMVPASVTLLDALPLKRNGKVDRSALPAPTQERPCLKGGYVAPTNAVEELLAEVWGQVLGLRQVGIHDDFFVDLGGHSLLATQVVSRLRDALDTEVPLRLVFERSTIASLAAELAAAPSAGALERRAQLLLAVERMSPEEVAARLTDRQARLPDEVSS